LPGGLRRPARDPGTAVREGGRIHQAFACLPRREPQGADPRARRDQRLRRVLPREPADGVHAACAETRSGGDEYLRGPAAGARWMRAHVQSPCGSRDARERGHAGTDRFMESDMGILRVEPPATFEVVKGNASRESPGTSVTVRQCELQT